MEVQGFHLVYDGQVFGLIAVKGLQFSGREILADLPELPAGQGPLAVVTDDLDSIFFCRG